MSRKIVRRPVPEDTLLPDSLHPVLKRVFAAREVKSLDEIDYTLASLHPFDTLTNINSAVGLLEDALMNKKRILVVADFDTDGATSCALAIRGLNLLGIDDVAYVVPNRFEYGYGLTPEIVDVALEFDPDLLITVDNGISSIEGVRHARQNGLQVLITDHHLPAEVLPEANAIVNPQLAGDCFPSKNLAGVGVMFYLLLALRARLKETGWFEKNATDIPNLARLLDLVALGTVADVVPLDRNNRIMVAHGLKLIRSNNTICGISALLAQANRNMETVTASDLGFAIAPRLNAAGRLTDMSLGIECLLTDDMQSAKEYAAQLDELNRERRQIQDEMQAQAMLEMSEDPISPASESANGICLFNPEWHQGVIGILAARVKERFNRPVIAFARESESILKGSARSIKGLHIRDLLEEVARLYPDLILTFGGHAMAAGLTINETDFTAFNSCFDELVTSWLSDEDIKNECLTDGQLETEHFTMQLAHEIRSSGPWGQAFPEPLFDGVFRVVDKRIVGNNHLKLRLQPENAGKMIDAIAFNMTDSDWGNDPELINVVYRVSINDYLGRESLQLMVEHIEPLIST